MTWMVESVTALDFFLKFMSSGLWMLNNVQPYDREKSDLLGGFSVRARRQVVCSSVFILYFLFGPGEDSHHTEVDTVKIRK